MAIDRETGYYTHRDILSYNCKYNIVLSGRGPGKTWDGAWMALNVKGPVMILTRTQPDMMYQINSYFDPYYKGDAKHEKIAAERFTQWGSEKSGINVDFDGVTKFYFRTLSAVNAIKQESFPENMEWIIFEEFVPMAWKKIGGVVDEGEALETIVKTVEHDTPANRAKKGLRPVRVIMHGNPGRWDNPLLSYFGCMPFGEGIRRMSDKVVVEILAERDTGDQYVNAGIATSRAWEDQLHFIERPPKGAEPMASIRFNTSYYLIYRHQCVSYVVSRSSHSLDSKHRWGTLEGLREDERCIDDTRMCEMIFRDAYKGRTRYADINTKFNFLRDLREAE